MEMWLRMQAVSWLLQQDNELKIISTRCSVSVRPFSLSHSTTCSSRNCMAGFLTGYCCSVSLNLSSTSVCKQQKLSGHTFDYRVTDICKEIVTGLALKTMGVWNDRSSRERKTRCVSDLLLFTCTRHSLTSWQTNSSKCWVFREPNTGSFTGSDTVCAVLSTLPSLAPVFSPTSSFSKQILTDFFFWGCLLLPISGWHITCRWKVK